MSIQSIGNRPDMAIQPLKQPIVRGKSGIAQELKEAIQAKVETGDGGQVKQGEQRGEGVVGLLQEGHFKGVADIRLRINFYDQLQTATTEKTTEALATGSEALVAGLEAQIEDFMTQFPLPAGAEDPMANFKEAADGLIGALEDGSSDSATVLEGLKGAFGNFMVALQQNEPVPAEDAGGAIETVPDITDETEGTEGAAAVAVNPGEDASVAAEEPEVAELNAFSVSLKELQDWFDQQIGSLEKSAADLQAMPPLSEPSGNGVAYSRFLEMYNALEGKSGSGEAAGTDTGGIVTEA